VGESGCGQVDCPRTCCGLGRADRRHDQAKGFLGHHALGKAANAAASSADADHLPRIRSRSLNPRMVLLAISSRAVAGPKALAHGRQRSERVAALFAQADCGTFCICRQFPHEFFPADSGSASASPRALALNPNSDHRDCEPSHRLDVSIQAQVINLMWLFSGRKKSLLPVHRPYLGRCRAQSATSSSVNVSRQDRHYTDNKRCFEPRPSIHGGAAGGIALPQPQDQSEEAVAAGDVPSPINPPPGLHIHSYPAVPMPRRSARSMSRHCGEVSPGTEWPAICSDVLAQGRKLLDYDFSLLIPEKLRHIYLTITLLLKNSRDKRDLAVFGARRPLARDLKIGKGVFRAAFAL